MREPGVCAKMRPETGSKSQGVTAPRGEVSKERRAKEKSGRVLVCKKAMSPTCRSTALPPFRGMSLPDWEVREKLMPVISGTSGL